MRRIKQKYKNDCGIACISMLSGLGYTQTMLIAKSELSLDQYDTFHTSKNDIIKLATATGVYPEKRKFIKFEDWIHLPNTAILALKYKSMPHNEWHWVVFARRNYQAFVLDPSASIRSNRRTDFGNMHPFSFIPIVDPK